MEDIMKAYTIKDFQREYPDDAACLEWLRQSRWPKGIKCETCKRITKHHRITKRPAYACDRCGHHVYPLAGTILEKSPTSLQTWFYAMYLMASTRCGVSAKQIQRETGVTYKTAWRICKQIRLVLAEQITLEGSSVEVDETYIGGYRPGKRGRGAAGKSIVIGAVKRGGPITVQVIPDVKASTLVPFVREKVMPKSIIYTDELPSYNHLKRLGYVHKRIHHATKVYVQGDIHTNNIEGFWSLAKRGIDGVYHAVSRKYLQTYMNEYAFRYNRRNDERPMFEAMLSQLGKCVGGA
jgi:transposase-like protein